MRVYWFSKVAAFSFILPVYDGQWDNFKYTHNQCMTFFRDDHGDCGCMGGEKCVQETIECQSKSAPVRCSSCRRYDIFRLLTICVSVSQAYTMLVECTSDINFCLVIDDDKFVKGLSATAGTDQGGPSSA